MYLTITSTAHPATDLGYLLHKHPDRAQTVDISAGVAHVFYPEATAERCTVAVLLEIDPIALVRGRRYGGDTFALSQYVNDRPYAASSMLAVALGKVFRTALGRRCDARPDLVATPLPLDIHLPAVPTVGGAGMVRELFEPLGWAVDATPIVLDETMPAWGDSRYVDLRLHADMVLADALSHLYVLLPVLDTAKHYWVSADEVDKLLRAGAGWLVEHPARDVITRRYLAHQRDFIASATRRLAEIDDVPGDTLDATAGGDAPADGDANASDRDGDTPAPRTSLRARRGEAVLAALRTARASRVVDLGCGEGALLRELVKDPAFAEVVGVDVSPQALQVAERRMGFDRMPDSQRARVRLMQSSLTYRDERIAGYDAVVLMEVIEHLDPERLPALESCVFVHARPSMVVVTTPNAEYNVHYEGLASGAMRHHDHRFEWSRAEFAAWADGVAERNGYLVELTPVGDPEPDVGAPTQLAIFRRAEQQQRRAS